MANSTYREIQDNILNLLNKTDSTTRNRVKNWVNLGYYDFTLREVWPFREVTDTLTTVVGTQEYDLDTNFTDIDENNITAVSIQGDNEVKLAYMPYNKLRYYSPDLDGDANALPRYYYTKAGKIGFYPVPADTYTVTVDYYKVPTELSADGDTPIIPVAYREALMHYGLSLEHDFNTDPDLAQKAMNRYEQIVTLARQNLLNQPNDEGAFELIGPETFVNHTGLTGELT